MPPKNMDTPRTRSILAIIDPINADFTIGTKPYCMDHIPIISSGRLPMVAAKRTPFLSPIYSDISDVSSPNSIASGITAIEYITTFAIVEGVFIKTKMKDNKAKMYIFLKINT